MKSGTQQAIERVITGHGVKGAKVSAGNKAMNSLGVSALKVLVGHSDTTREYLQTKVIPLITNKAEGESFRAGVRDEARAQAEEFMRLAEEHPGETSKVNGMLASLRVMSSQLTTVGLMAGIGHGKVLAATETYKELVSTASALRKASEYATKTGAKKGNAGTKVTSVKAAQFDKIKVQVKLLTITQALALQQAVAGQIAHISRSAKATEANPVSDFSEHRKRKAA